MIIRDEKLLDFFRGAGACELCGKGCMRREPHHVIAKGMGGGRRLDIRINIVAVGSSPGMECQCHNNVDTASEKSRCLRIIAERERTTVEAIEAATAFILDLDKFLGTGWLTQHKVMALPAEPGRLVMDALKITQEDLDATRRALDTTF